MHNRTSGSRIKRAYTFTFVPSASEPPHQGAFKNEYVGCLIVAAPPPRTAHKTQTAGIGAKSHRYELLPVGLIEDGSLKQYAWAGNGIQAVSPGHLHNGDPAFGKLSLQLTHMQHAVMEAFLPHRSAVTEDYWEYIWWRAGHRLASAMLNNFATQALLAAVGVGAQSQLPAAATINWLLKDGLGRLGRLSVAARFGQSFDSDLKRFRWITSLVFSGSIALEFLTPLLPKQFLLLACLSNVGKSVGVTTYVATHPAFMRSFAVGENLADINAKGQAQQMVMDTLGLAICVGLTYAVRHRPRSRLLLPICSFPLLVCMDLICIFHELKATHLHTLNRERAELIAERWLSDGHIFNAKEVSKQEKLLLNSQVGGGLLPLHFTTLDQMIHSQYQLADLLKRHSEQDYLLDYSHQVFRPPYPGARNGKGHLPACLRHGASSVSILEAILQAAIFRKMFNLADNSQLYISQAANTKEFGAQRWMPTILNTYLQRMASIRVEKSLDPRTLLQGVDGVRWSYSQFDETTGQTAIAKAAKLATMAAPSFVSALEGAGWNIHPMKLSTRERNGYVLIS